MLKCASSRENCFLNRSELRNFPNDQLAAFAYALIRSKNTSGQQKKRKKNTFPFKNTIQVKILSVLSLESDIFGASD